MFFMFVSILIGLPIFISVIALIGGIFLGIGLLAGEAVYTVDQNGLRQQIGPMSWFKWVTIELIDMTGRVVQHIFNGQVLEGEITLITADLTELPVGMYFMRYSSPTDVRINKVQLMR